MKKLYTTTAGIFLISTSIFAQTLVASYSFNGNANDASGYNGTVKKFFTFFVVLLILSISVMSQPAVQWQHFYGGTGDDYLYGFNNKPTSDGGAILCGTTTSSNTGTFTGLTNNGGVDGVIIKLDASGNTTMQKIYGGSGDDAIYGIRQTADGGYIAVGEALSSNSGTLTGVTNNGGQDGWVMKLNSAGAIMWQKLLGGSGDDILYSASQTSDGGYILSGSSASSNSGTLTGINSNGGLDGWILKLDGSGNTVWQKLLGGSGFDRLIGSEQTKDGGYIAAGTATGSDGTLTGVTSYGGLDGWLIKFDTAGNTTWQKLYGGQSDDQLQFVEQTTDGGYIVALAAANVNQITGTYTKPGYGQYDGWVVKTDALGNLQWQQLLGTSSQDYFDCVLQTSDGGYILTGQSSSSYAADHGSLTGLTTQGGLDGWIVKLNGAGDVQWQELLGGTLDDNLSTVQETSDGGYFAVGYSSSSNTGTLTGLTSNGGVDGWTVKLAPYATPKKPGSGHALQLYSTGSLATSPYVNVGSGFDFGSQPFTYETWLKRDTVETTLGDRGKGLFVGDNDNSWGVGFINNNTLFFSRIGVDHVVSTGTIADTNWHHVAVVYTGTQVQFYIDGVLSGTPAYSAAFNNTTGNYFIGNRQSFGNANGDETLAGKIDETRIWRNVALTQTEIRDWMCKKVTSAHPAYNNLFAYFRFDEGTGSTTYSADGRVGSLINSPTWVTSGASIGDTSAYDYTNATKTVMLGAPTGETFTVTSTSGNPAGIQVYRVDTLPNTLTGTAGTGINHKYFGVFQSGGISPLYSAVYNYGGNASISGNDPTGFRLYRRHNNADVLWTDAVATLNTTNKTLTVAGASTEYMLGSILNPLPVTLISFSAIKNGSDVVLNWQTTNEENLKNYIVEKSTNATTFSQLTVVNANDNTGINNYTATDMNPVNGVNYYRLKQIDADGKYTYSAIRSVNFSDNFKVFISPNPATNNIKIYTDQMLMSVQIMNVSGKTIKWLIPSSNNLYNVSDLQKGIYFLRITTKAGTQILRLSKM